MSMLDNIQSLIGIIATLTTGGVLGTIIGLRYRNRTEKAKSKQEEARADQEDAETEKMNISNAAELVEMYKKALNDIEDIYKRKEVSLTSQLTEVQGQVKELSLKVQEYQLRLTEKDDVITDITRSQLKMKLDMESMKMLMVEDCTNCSVVKTCVKYKLKQNMLNNSSAVENC